MTPHGVEVYVGLEPIDSLLRATGRGGLPAAGAAGASPKLFWTDWSSCWTSFEKMSSEGPPIAPEDAHQKVARQGTL